jgi:hypothetical protein
MRNLINHRVLFCLPRSADVYGDPRWKTPHAAYVADPLISEDRHNSSIRIGIGRNQLRLAALRQPIEGKQ